MIAAWAVVKEMDFIDHQGAQGGEEAGRSRQQRIGRFRRGDQHRRRTVGGDGAGVAAFHAQVDAQCFQWQAQPFIEVAHQGAGGADVQNRQGRWRLTRRVILGKITFEQRGNGRFGLAAGGGRNDQRILSGQNRGDRSLLHRGEIAVARKKGRPSMEKAAFDFSARE